MATGRELFESMADGQMPERIPFIPTIYEHAAKVIGKTPSQVAIDGDLLVEGQLACYERYRHDLVSVGLDIYNVECEALGAKVVYYDSDELPSISDVLLADPARLGKLDVPNPEKAARMPMLLDATERIHRAIGDEVIVNGTIVGPFTLAAILRGFENFIVDLMTDPGYAKDLMEFARDVGMAFAKAYIDRGLGISINESWIAPPLLSPEMFEGQVLELETDIIQGIKALGQKNVALICGGDTTPIAHHLVNTGTSLLLADSNTDQGRYVELCAERRILVRASIAPKLVKSGEDAELAEAVREVVGTCGAYFGFIFGCGIVSYDTEPERVKSLKSLLSMTPRSLASQSRAKRK